MAFGEEHVPEAEGLCFFLEVIDDRGVVVPSIATLGNLGREYWVCSASCLGGVCWEKWL